jgi:hypothetical protein
MLSNTLISLPRRIHLSDIYCRLIETGATFCMIYTMSSMNADHHWVQILEAAPDEPYR